MLSHMYCLQAGVSHLFWRHCWRIWLRSSSCCLQCWTSPERSCWSCWMFGLIASYCQDQQGDCSTSSTSKIYDPLLSIDWKIVVKSIAGKGHSGGKSFFFCGSSVWSDMRHEWQHYNRQHRWRSMLDHQPTLSSLWLSDFHHDIPHSEWVCPAEQIWYIIEPWDSAWLAVAWGSWC